MTGINEALAHAFFNSDVDNKVVRKSVFCRILYYFNFPSLLNHQIIAARAQFIKIYLGGGGVMVLSQLRLVNLRLARLSSQT